MEKGDQESKLNFDEQFDRLPYGSLIKLPISMIHPTDVDDGKDSMTDEPTEIYREDKSRKLYIYDGNHRYHDGEKDLTKRLGYDHRDEELIEFKKVKNDKPW